MSTTPLERTLIYHDATKHHPGRFARGLGYLDWANQPDPFRRFADCERVRLSLPTPDDAPPYDALFDGRPVPIPPLDPRVVSALFECSLAVSAWKQAGRVRWALRCNPSSGNLHPTEGYILLPPAAGIADATAVFHYAPREHALERRAVLPAEAWPILANPFPAGAFFVGLSSVLWRETWKYGERAFRYCQHDVGHALAALRFAAAALGRRLIVLSALGDADVSRVLGLDRSDDFANAEREHPDLLAVVVPIDAAGPIARDLAPAAVEAVAAAQWTGRANRLSEEHAQWDLIDMAADATTKPRTPTEPWPAELATAPPVRAAPAPRAATARQIIRQRRSAVAFDGQTSITTATFFHMLARTMPDEARQIAPWDVFGDAARIHLLMFVHRVAGLSPGLYALVRDRERIGALRAACKPDFEWQSPSERPADLPLYRLMTCDCRRAAAQLSLGQEIAGDSAFSLGMIAEFEPTLRRDGPWSYRRLFWEAGLVGQILYLEAEAAGVRATGIGAYFDDEVHGAFGLEDRTFQSLYHFTVGGPIDDPRLTTLPAYPAPG